MEHYSEKKGLVMYFMLSTNGAKNQHLNQEWQQVPRSEEHKAGIQ